MTDSEVATLKQRQKNELRDVLRLFCLNLGCQHKRVAEYLASGSLDKYSGDLGSCDEKCTICAGNSWKRDTWGDNFLPVVRDGLEMFFWREPDLCQAATYNNLMKLVWDNEVWIEQIFDKKK